MHFANSQVASVNHHYTTRKKPTNLRKLWNIETQIKPASAQQGYVQEQWPPTHSSASAGGIFPAHHAVHVHSVHPHMSISSPRPFLEAAGANICPREGSALQIHTCWLAVLLHDLHMTPDNWLPCLHPSLCEHGTVKHKFLCKFYKIT